MKKLNHLSLALIIVLICMAILFIQQKGRVHYRGGKLKDNETVSTRWEERFFEYLPNVNNKILFLGDSHLAIYPWHEFADITYANRAVSGYTIQDIDLDRIHGIPSCVVLSIGTNDIQMGCAIKKIVTRLDILLQSIKDKWPDAVFIYVSPPLPETGLYEKTVRPTFPNITRPSADAINAITACAENKGFLILYARSALVDGLHIDPSSAKEIAVSIEKLANQSFRRTR